MKKVVGSLEVITGVMFSGKSEELIRRIKRAIIAKQTVYIAKPTIDNRYKMESIITHDGMSVFAEPVLDPGQILKEGINFDVVAIDEVQFFPEKIIEICESLIWRGKRVIVAGTDMDFKGLPFGSIPYLMAMADDVVKLHAICIKCGGKAVWNQRLIDGKPADYDSPTVLVGGKDSYEARCRQCYEPPDHTNYN